MYNILSVGIDEMLYPQYPFIQEWRMGNIRECEECIMAMDEIKNISSFDAFKIDDSAYEGDFRLIDGLLFEDGKRSFLGFDSCKSNVLGERDDSVIRALCYDAK